MNLRHLFQLEVHPRFLNRQTHPAMPSDPFTPLTQSILDPLSKAYQRWKSVRIRLAHTIQDYVDACNDLNAAFSRHSGQSSFEKTLVCIDADMSGLEQDYARLSRTHVVLSRSRNQSKKLAPINALPPEILSQILRYAARICVNQLGDSSTSPHYVYPGVLASVCSIWRKTVVNLPSLWSHIDLTISKVNTYNQSCRAKAWSEYANNVPLYVHVLPVFNPTTVDESDALKPLELLASLAKDVRFLRVGSTEHLGQRILACWVKHGSPGVARSLELGTTDPELVELLSWDPSAVDDVPPVQVEEFFYSLQSLDLAGFHIPWESKIYHGLVRLSLEATLGGGCHQLAQLQLATILRSSPRLRELKLVDVVVGHEAWVAPKPIVLEDLEVLVLHINLVLVLPLIAPGLKPLGMSFLLNKDPMSLEIVRSFFSRSIIETLDLANVLGAHRWFPFVMGPLQHLKTLILVDCSFSDSDIHDFLVGSPESAVPWPRLRVLHLAGCMLNDDILLKLLSMHSVQTLRLHSCTTNCDSMEPRDAELETLQLKELLTRVIPDTRLNYNPDDDPSNSYLC